MKPSILKKKQDTCCFGVGNSDKDSLRWGFQYLSSTAAERVWDFPSQVRWPQVSCRRICLKLAGLHTCQLSLIQSETQSIAPSKIRLQSEKEWENRPNFNQLYIYIYVIIEQNFEKIAPLFSTNLTQLPHLRLAGLLVCISVSRLILCCLKASHHWTNVSTFNSDGISRLEESLNWLIFIFISFDWWQLDRWSSVVCCCSKNQGWSLICTQLAITGQEIPD